MGVPIFDSHCDVLYQLWKRNDPSLFYKTDSDLHCSYWRLRQGFVQVQTLAVFIPPEVPQAQKTVEALRMIDMVHHFILKAGKKIQLLKPGDGWPQIKRDQDVLYILLSLEGADPIGDNLSLVRIFYELGISSLGLTWNYRNLVADGVGERNPGGLSRFGIELVKELNRLSVAIDISHLAEPAFWDVISLSDQPVMASHCNVRKLCDHPRNLSDAQITAIFKQGGVIGINFVPQFVSQEGRADWDGLLRHLDHLLSLGGEDHIGFGSDFDGSPEIIEPLSHSGCWQQLVEKCQSYFSDDIIYKLFFSNWQKYYAKLWTNSAK